MQSTPEQQQQSEIEKRRRLRALFDVYRLDLDDFTREGLDRYARTEAEDRVARYGDKNGNRIVDDRPSLTGIYEAHVARVKHRLWCEAIEREFPEQVEKRLAASVTVARDQRFPGWPGFVRTVAAAASMPAPRVPVVHNPAPPQYTDHEDRGDAWESPEDLARARSA